VNDVIEVLREANKRTTPPHQFDFNGALRAGKARARRRHMTQLGVSLAVPAIVVAAVALWPDGGASSPSPAPPAETGDVDRLPEPPHEIVATDDAFTIFTEAQSEDDKVLVSDLLVQADFDQKIEPSSFRKAGSYDGFDFYLAKAHPDPDVDGPDIRQYLCLHVVEEETAQWHMSSCSGGDGVAVSLDPDFQFGPLLSASGGAFDTVSVWPDADVAGRLVDAHAGWTFIAENLAVMDGESAVQQTWWGEWLEEAAQHYSVLGDPQWVDDLLPDDGEGVVPWTSRLLGEHEGTTLWLGLGEDQETCLAWAETGSDSYESRCWTADDGKSDELSEEVEIDGEGTIAFLVPDNYEPSEDEHAAWPFIGPNLVVERS
jgi:hypothetical protein